MKKSDYGFLTLLALLAGFIWFRDLEWISTFDDTVTLLVVIPLFIWIGSPWKWRKDFIEVSPKTINLAIALFLLGVIFSLTILLSISWSLLLWAWLAARIEPDPERSLPKLMVLTLMAFPWVSLDADRLGWWFRISGAWVAALFYQLLGYDVIFEGTTVTIDGLPISVEAACAGLNTLQSMLIAGTLVAYILLKDTPKFWWNIPLLFVIAWIANTVRIISLSAAALIVSPDFALGAFHTWGGWAILMFTFGFCWLLFSLQQPRSSGR